MFVPPAPSGTVRCCTLTTPGAIPETIRQTSPSESRWRVTARGVRLCVVGASADRHAMTAPCSVALSPLEFNAVTAMNTLYDGSEMSPWHVPATHTEAGNSRPLL